MDDLERLVTDCVYLEGKDGEAELANLAFLSLRVALRAYFGTYRTVRGQLRALVEPEALPPKGVSVDELYPESYIEASAEVVVHFQHFVELICKDILRRTHRLLPTIAPDDPVIFHKALTGAVLSPLEDSRFKTVEFSIALQRLCDLIRAGVVDPQVYGFLLDSNRMLSKLNNLRNRIWHRGAHVLRYSALDTFVARYLLPLAARISDLPQYASCRWRPRDTKCGVDPVNELIELGRSAAIAPMKAALLKELGRAAYECPLRAPFVALDENARGQRGLGAVLASLDRQHITRAKRIAQSELGENGAAGVKDCPVCSIHALIVYHDVDVQDYDPEEGTATMYDYVWQIKCACCSFSIDYDVGSPNADHGLPIEDYW